MQLLKVRLLAAGHTDHVYKRNKWYKVTFSRHNLLFTFQNTSVVFFVRGSSIKASLSEYLTKNTDTSSLASSLVWVMGVGVKCCKSVCELLFSDIKIYLRNSRHSRLKGFLFLAHELCVCVKIKPYHAFSFSSRRNLGFYFVRDTLRINVFVCIH